MNFKDVRELDQNKKLEWQIISKKGRKGIAIKKKIGKGTLTASASRSKYGGKKVELGFKIPLK